MLIWTVGAQDQQPQVMEGWEFGVMRFEFMPGSDDEFLTLGLKIRRQGEPTCLLIREICIGSLSQKRSIALFLLGRLPCHNHELFKRRWTAGHRQS